MQPNVEQSAPVLLVSVIVVTRNEVEALRRCLAALEASKNREQIEILVVDNGSHDGCQSIDSEFPEVTVLRLPHHCGLTKARNIGLRTAKGDYVLLLSPEVEVAPGAIIALKQRLEEDTAALAVCPLLIDEDGTEISVARRLPDPVQVSSHWRDPWTLPAAPLGDALELHDGMAIFLRRKTIQGINYLDQKYGEHWIDVDLAYQIRRAGKKIALARDITSVVRRQTRREPSSSYERAAFLADAAAGAARYLSKNFGFARGMGFRIQIVLLTFFKVLTFQDLSCNVSLMSRLLNGFKIDGTSQQL